MPHYRSRTSTHGRFIPLAEDHPTVWAYARELDGQRLTLVANLRRETTKLFMPARGTVRGSCLCHTAAARDNLAGEVERAPWEAVAVLGPAAGSRG